MKTNFLFKTLIKSIIDNIKIRGKIIAIQNDPIIFNLFDIIDGKNECNSVVNI